jgi:hypothetical protein
VLLFLGYETACETHIAINNIKRGDEQKKKRKRKKHCSSVFSFSSSVYYLAQPSIHLTAHPRQFILSVWALLVSRVILKIKLV